MSLEESITETTTLSFTESVKSQLIVTKDDSISEEGATEPQYIELAYERGARLSDYMQFIKPTYSDYGKQTLQEQNLFQQILTSDVDGDVVDQSEPEVPSILVTGFGMRNLKSLQDALMAEEKRKRLEEIYRRQLLAAEEEEALQASTSSISKKTSHTALSTETETTESFAAYQSIAPVYKQRLDYLLGLEQGEEETTVAKEEVQSEQEEFHYSDSISMKRAQEYLRLHRIFDFFQFIITHLLGSHTSNPITFIIELLNKCLTYRMKLGPPPVLYEIKHINQLFIMMDRIEAGHIEAPLYHKAMKSLGICEYNQNPQLTEDGYITKEVFITEVYAAEVGLLDDLVKIKYMDKLKQIRKMRLKKVSVENVVSKSSSGSYFMPSDLFKSLEKKEKKQHIKSEEVIIEEGG